MSILTTPTGSGRGQAKVDADWNYTGAGVNYARLARLGLRTVAGSWQIATT